MWIYTDEKLPTPGKLVEVSVAIGTFTWVDKGWINKRGIWIDYETDKLFEGQVYSWRNWDTPIAAPLKKEL